MKKPKKDLENIELRVQITHTEKENRFTIETYKSSIVVYAPSSKDPIYIGARDAENLGKALLKAAKHRRLLDAEAKKNGWVLFS